MSVQWTIAAGCLYTEAALVLLLVLPVASARTWQRILKSRFLVVFTTKASWYFYIVLVSLAILCLDAIREINKYSHIDISAAASHSADLQANMRKFRAQRNFFISGFALFLSLVLRRLLVLISTLAIAEAQSEAAIKQAQGASSAARNILAQTGVTNENTVNEAHDKIVSGLKNEIADLKTKLEKEKKDKDAVKKQAEATNSEYDRLTLEYSKLQKSTQSQSSVDKKAD